MSMKSNSLTNAEVEEFITRYHSDKLLRIMRHEALVTILQVYQSTSARARWAIGGVVRKAKTPDKTFRFDTSWLESESPETFTNVVGYWTKQAEIVTQQSPFDLILGAEHLNPKAKLDINNPHLTLGVFLMKHSPPTIDSVVLTNKPEDFELIIQREEGGIWYLAKPITNTKKDYMMLGSVWRFDMP